MYIDNILFWTTILSGIIIGLVVGGILGFAGYFIWKRQHLYSKKSDAYTSFINTIFDFVSFISSMYKLRVTDENAVESIVNSQETIDKCQLVLKEKVVFVFYFGEKIEKPINEIIDLYVKFRKKESLSMNIEEIDNYLFERLQIISDLKFK